MTRHPSDAFLFAFSFGLAAYLCTMRAICDEQDRWMKAIATGRSHS